VQAALVGQVAAMPLYPPHMLHEDFLPEPLHDALLSHALLQEESFSRARFPPPTLDAADSPAGRGRARIGLRWHSQCAEREELDLERRKRQQDRGLDQQQQVLEPRP
jgi:hypothetical protein